MMRFSIRNSVLLVFLSEVIFWVLGCLIYRYFDANVEEFRLEYKDRLVFLYYSRIIILAFVIALWSKKKRLEKYAGSRTLGAMIRNFSTVQRTIKFLFLLWGISLLLIGWCNPQFGKNEKKMKTSGIDIMICLDVSNSMLANDLSQNRDRLEVAKLAINQMLKSLKGDRVGVVVFAGSAYSYIPITNDYDYLKVEMLSINPGMMSTQGTAIGSAIETAMTSFDDTKTNKAIMIFTDGENHEHDALDAAKDARKKGVKVYTVGMGTTKSVPIPRSNGRDFHKDKNGRTVLTKLNAGMLRNLATQGGGLYEQAVRTSVNTKKLVEDIDKIEKTKFQEKEFLEYEDRFQWFLAFGFVFLLLNQCVFRD